MARGLQIGDTVRFKSARWYITELVKDSGELIAKESIKIDPLTTLTIVGINRVSPGHALIDCKGTFVGGYFILRDVFNHTVKKY